MEALMTFMQDYYNPAIAKSKEKSNKSPKTAFSVSFADVN